MTTHKTITIVGAGLAGSLLSIYLAKRGYTVQVLESRVDIRKHSISAGRSINLALSHRGLSALKEVGLDTTILKEAVQMKGRMIHTLDNQLLFSPYSSHSDEYINSISRGDLNKILLTEAEKYPNVHLHFQEECTEADLSKGQVISLNKSNNQLSVWNTDVIIGTDGANSAVRNSIQQYDSKFNGNVTWEEHGYKELCIYPNADGGFKIDSQSLHIWPRGTYMLIALPNFDGSFTCTLFFPMEGENSFASLDSSAKVRAFFEEKFADTIPLFEDLETQFLTNPVGRLGTLRCAPYFYKDKAVLLGDAAHAVVPFYGQGMNASFEDCMCLNHCIDMFGDDWEAVFHQYYTERKINSDAIADLAVENFAEMRDHTANPIFIKKRRLEYLLETKFPNYYSKYALVTFHPEFPYSYAKERGNKQDAFLMELCAKTENIAELDLEEVYLDIQKL